MSDQKVAWNDLPERVTAVFEPVLAQFKYAAGPDTKVSGLAYSTQFGNYRATILGQPVGAKGARYGVVLSCGYDGTNLKVAPLVLLDGKWLR